MAEEIDIITLKAEARATARAGTLSYCQALDAIAARFGFPHWKALIASRPAASAPVEARRRAAQQINDWVGDIIQNGFAMHRLLRDAALPYADRYLLALARLAILNRKPDKQKAHILNAAAHVIASLADDVLCHNDYAMIPDLWIGRPLAVETLRDAACEMHARYVSATISDRTPAEHASPLAQASAWTWFDDMAMVARHHDRREAAEVFEDMREASYADMCQVETAVASLAESGETSASANQPINPSQIAQARAQFEKMIVERYLVRTTGHAASYIEPARRNLAKYLSDNQIAFGDPSRSWNRDLANKIADDDLTIWVDAATK